MPDQTILLIDFDPRSIEDTLRSLTEAGYRVEVANDGLAGLEAFKKVHPDLVLIEPMVPRKHGFEVCKEIKQSEQGRGIPVLITTGFYTGKKHSTQARQTCGCDDYLEKPVSAEMLLSACRRFLEEPEIVSDSIPTDEEIDAAVWEMEPEPAPTGDSREMPSLDDLTEDEIIAHLDALIVEQPAAEQVAQEAEPTVEAEPEVEAASETAGMSRKLRLLLVAAGLIALIVVGTIVSLQMMKGGDAATTPAVKAPENVPALVVEAAVEPEATITEDLTPVEVAAPEIVSPPPPQIVKQKRVPKPRVELLPTLPFTELEPAPEPIAEFDAVAVQKLPAVELQQGPSAPPIPKAKFGELVDIAEVDSPPVPLDKQMPPYSPVARRLRHEGTVLLRLLINEQGSVEQVEVVSNNAGDILKQTAVDGAKRWTYRPAEKDGVTVKVWILERVLFKL